MTKSWKNLWALFLFRDRGILPTGRLLVVLVIFSAGVLLFGSRGMSWPWIVAVNAVFLLATLVDLFASPRKKALTWNRQISEDMERGIRYTVTIGVENTSPRDCRFRLVDGLPQSFQAPFPVSGRVGGGASASTTYEAVAPVRGKYEVQKLHIRYRSRFGLWEKQTAVLLEDTVKVIPDLTETKQFLESAQQYLLYEGEKIRKRRGETGEFAQIRSYVVGDDPRMINWHQTAKLQEVMTNEYEPEHGKYVTILIDCGRMMGAELKKGNRLEKALEAAMTVAAAALKSGDYVGVLAFSKDVHVFVPPAKGMEQLQKILQTIYDLEVDRSESNYPAVMSYLQTVQKKRSLILLFSDVQTFLHEESALVYLRRLRRKHLFLMIGVEDETLLGQTRQEPGDVWQTMMKSMAQQQMYTKKRRKAEWERQGLHMVEAEEERLANAAVSHYIRIMNQGLL